jgi:Tfp pilus assembly protein PilO
LLSIKLSRTLVIGKDIALFFEKKQILIFVFAVLTIGGFVLFRYIPMKKNIRAIKQKRAEQNLIIAKGISDSEQLPVFTEQLDKLKEKLENYENNIPKQRDIGFFLIKISELMNRHNLQEQAIEPLEEAEIDELICIPVSMECKGQLKQIFEFYKNLQELDRQIRIKTVKIKNGNDFNGEIMMETEIVIYCRTQVS